MTPVRGQVVYVEQVGLERWWLDGSGPVYVVPRSRDIVVGGTDDEGEWDRRPAPEVARRVLERAVELVPALSGARVLRHRVGLRPARPDGAPRGRAARAAGSCTATGTAAPGSRCPGAARTRSSDW